MLYNLIAAKRDFAIHSPKLGDIRPRNVFINQSGGIKVSNLLSWPNEGTNDQKAFDKEATYLGKAIIIQHPKKLHRWLMGQPKHIKMDRLKFFRLD